MSARFGRLAWLWLSVLVIAFDQATKHYFEASFSLYQKVDVIPGYFAWTLAYNTGAAFSFLADHGGWQRWLFHSWRQCRAGGLAEAAESKRNLAGSSVGAGVGRRAGQSL